MSNHTYSKKISGDSIDLFLVFQVERETIMIVDILGWKRLKLFLLAGDKTKEIGYVLEFELFLLAGDKTNEIGYGCSD